MGFLISFSFFFLAIIINQSTVVGQTTAESVIEFPKNDIRDITGIITYNTSRSNSTEVVKDIPVIAISRKNAIVRYTVDIASISDGYAFLCSHSLQQRGD